MIVVGVDGSEESKPALDWALDEARLRQTPLRAVYAWGMPVLGPWDFIPSPDLLDPKIIAGKAREHLGVGARGHGGFVGLLLGSVSQQCAQHTLAPIAIVRRPASGAEG